MTSLDPMYRRMFPTLAATEDRMRWYIRGAKLVIILAVYVLGRDVLSEYRAKAATENMQAMVGRVNSLEATCQKENPKRLTTTRAQAAILIEQKDRERRDNGRTD